MSTDCSFFGGSSGNPACANWWITMTFNLSLCYIERKYKERKIKGNSWAWKKCIADEGTTHPLQRHP
jgi:hypothetical protein